MNNKDREQRFIDKCREQFGTLSFESEMLLRYGFSCAADELGHVARAQGIEEQKQRVFDALGLYDSKELGA